MQYQTQRKGARKFWRSKVQEQIKAQAADTSGLTNIKSNLDVAWVKIQDALQQEAEGHNLWIEGTLELINILDDARMQTQFGIQQSLTKRATRPEGAIRIEPLRCRTRKLGS